jgi:colicin import membrane protein
VQFGLIVSIVLHAAVLGWAFITIHTQRELRMAEPEAIITGLVSETDLTKLKQGVRTAKQIEAVAKDVPKPDVAKKEVARPKIITAPPPSSEPPAPRVDPIAEKLAAAEGPPSPPTVAEEHKKLDAMLKEQAQKEEQRRAEEQKRAEEERRQVDQKKKADEERRQKEAALRKKREEEKRKRVAELKRKQEEEKRRQEEAKKKFDPDAIEKQLALLDRDPRKKNAAAATPPPEKETKQKGPTLGAPEGRDQQISASEAAMLRARISSRLKSCWRLPSGGGGSDTPAVTLRWRMNPDGSVEGEPQVEQPRGDALFRIAAEAAVRAVRECSPFDLPTDKYAAWRVITWEFDPSQMM